MSVEERYFPFCGEIREELLGAVQALSQEALDWKPIDHPKVRSIADLLRHIATSEDYWIRVIIGGEGERQERTAESHPKLSDILDDLERVRERTRAYMASISAHDLRETRHHERHGEKPIAWILFHIFEHDSHHKAQILQNLRLQDPDR